MALTKGARWLEPGFRELETDFCFYCSDNVSKAEPLIVWMNRGGHAYWHPACAEKWLLAFARDVWECKQEDLLPKA